MEGSLPGEQRLTLGEDTAYDVLSQKMRKQVEEVFGWLKTIGLMRKTRDRGLARAGWMFTLATAIRNLVRIRNSTAEVA